jgi:hypothetical protein
MILQRNNPANVRIDEYGGAEENYNLLKGDKMKPINFNQANKNLLKPEESMKITFMFCWFDLWIGAYWNSQTSVLYICPFPMCVIRIERR